MGIIIAGFATVGKTYLASKYNNIIDMESGNFKYDYTGYENIPYEQRKGMPDRKLNVEWPTNYYKAIEDAKSKYDVIFVQLHPLHLDYFDKNNIEYYIAYPSLDEWDYVEQKCINRGNNSEWIKRLKNVFEDYYEVSKKSNSKEILVVSKEKSLEEILKDMNYIK